MPHMEPKTHEQRRTATEELERSVGKLPGRGLKQVLLMRNLTLIS